MSNPRSTSHDVRPTASAQSRLSPTSPEQTRPRPQPAGGQPFADVRWALAGFGAGGQQFHAPMIEAATGIELVAVVTTNPGRVDAAHALGLDVVDTVAGLADLGIEGVTITTPAGTHSALAHEALDLGLHVVVDKPFALTAEPAAAMVDHARRADRVLSTYQNRRWDGDLLTIQALVARGALGQVRRFESRLERFHPPLPSWIVNATAEEGGGTLVDFGPHLIDQAVYLFGRVKAVSAQLSAFGADAKAENDIRLELLHDSGVRSTIVGSLVAAAEGPRFLVNGERGGLVIEGFDVQEQQLGAGETPTTLGDGWGREPATRTARVTIDGQTHTQPLVPGRWTEYYPAIARAVRIGAPPPVDPADSVHVCEVFDAARLSSLRQRTVEIPSRARVNRDAAPA